MVTNGLDPVRGHAPIQRASHEVERDLDRQEIKQRSKLLIIVSYESYLRSTSLEVFVSHASLLV